MQMGDPSGRDNRQDHRVWGKAERRTSSKGKKPQWKRVVPDVIVLYEIGSGPLVIQMG